MVLRSTTTRTALLVLVTALLAALLVATPAAPGSAVEPPVPNQPVAAVVDDGAAQPLVRPHCERVSGALRCGVKYTNTESKVLVAAAIAAVAAGGVVACRNVTVCKILVATVGAALTTWWTAITRYDRCLFTYSTGTSTRPALVRC
jgi:hypothetical protein